MKIVDKRHLDEITDLQRQQTDIARRLGVIVREVAKMTTALGHGTDADARIGAHVLQHWPQAKQLLVEHEDLLIRQEETGLAVLSAMDLDPNAPGETYRIEPDGRVMRLGQKNGEAAWVDA